jgi:hypothetical protein
MNNLFSRITCTRLADKQKEYLVLLEISPRFPFNCSNIVYVPVMATGFGEAGRLAIEHIYYAPDYIHTMNSKPVVRAFFV